MFPIIGYPFGPGGYGGVFEVHRLRKTTRAIAIATTAEAGPVYFSDMMDCGKQGVNLRKVTGFIEWVCLAR